MQINIKGRQVRLQDETIKSMKRRLRFSLSRFGHAIQGVTVQLTDINGPKGGHDKECLIIVNLQKGGKVVVQGNGTDCDLALNHCADRIGRTVDRELTRRRTSPIRKMRRQMRAEKDVALNDENRLDPEGSEGAHQLP
ncbi:MAG TPA: HPF/RaiA family ribosome-associated protein [Desulfobulbus sp.]|nr:HPF/RaiA family ribosome-associated protein [Desulfobulbus sp.]